MDLVQGAIERYRKIRNVATAFNVGMFIIGTIPIFGQVRVDLQMKVAASLFLFKTKRMSPAFCIHVHEAVFNSSASKLL